MHNKLARDSLLILNFIESTKQSTKAKWYINKTKMDRFQN